MIRLAIVCCGLIGVLPTEPEQTPAPNLAAYEAARSRAGRGGDAQVKLALWCEAHDLTAERMKHLALAVLADPGNVAARGLLGLVADGRGRWRRPEEVARSTPADEARALAEYNARRERTPETAEAQWKLALWCESNGLKPEASAHLTAVTRLDPSRASAWKHLGYKLQGGRWKTPEQIAAETAETESLRRADRHWRPILERAKGYISFKDRSRRGQAEALLADLNDPHAVPSILAAFRTGGEPAQRLAVQVLGRIDTPASSRALAEFAVCSAWEPVRRASAETLRRRDPRDFIQALIARLRDPITYHVRPVGGPGQPGELIVEGDRFDLDRLYNPPPLPTAPITPGSSVGSDENGSPIVFVATLLQDNEMFSSLRPGITNLIRDQTAGSGLRASAVIANMLGFNLGLAVLPFQFQSAGAIRWGGGVQGPERTAVPVGKMAVEIDRAGYSLRGQLRDDVMSLEQKNAEVRRANDQIIGMLVSVLGDATGTTRTDWERWYNDRRGYVLASRSLASRETIFEEVAPSYTPAPIGRFVYDRQAGYYIPNRDCFAAGTTVRTLDGLRPIESVKIGDRVLAQDSRTGALGYQPVLVVHHNPPADVLRLELGGETILTTGVQRFWKARDGWVMARDLKPGDSLRTLGGLARISAVASEAVQVPVFNLEVSGGHDFFVGSAGSLVHDHTEVEPVDRAFDAGPAPDAVAESS